MSDNNEIIETIEEFGDSPMTENNKKLLASIVNNTKIDNVKKVFQIVSYLDVTNLSCIAKITNIIDKNI